MADRNQRPPNDLIEGQQYEWNDTFGLYIGETEDGKVVAWNPGLREWDTLTSMSEYEQFLVAHGAEPTDESTVKQASPKAEVGSLASGRPLWWNDRRDGPYPADWDVSRYGPYPKKVRYDADKNPVEIPEDDKDFGADRAYAAQLKLAIDKAYPQDKAQGRIVSGSEVGGPEGSYFIVKPDGSLVPWEPKPKESTGQLYPTYDEASKNTPPGYKPVQLSNGEWGFTSVPQQSLDDKIDQLVLSGDSGDLDKAWALDNIRDRMNAPRGLTPDQAANLVLGLAVSPDEARSWIDMLTSDWYGQRGMAPPSSATSGLTSEQQGVSDAIDEVGGLENYLKRTQGGESGATTGVSPFSQQWVSGRVGHDIIPDPNPGTSTPGRLYDATDHVWEPLADYNQRMQTVQGSSLPTATPSVVAPSPFQAYGFKNRDAWIAAGMPANVPPSVIYGGADQVSPKTQENTPFSDNPLGVPVITTTPFASPQSTPIRVRQPFSSGPNPSGINPSPDLFRSGNLAQYEQQLFGSKPQNVQDVLQQAFYRQFGQRQQRLFQSRRPQQITYA